jgi:hypothetical protein
MDKRKELTGRDVRETMQLVRKAMGQYSAFFALRMIKLWSNLILRGFIQSYPFFSSCAVHKESEYFEQQVMSHLLYMGLYDQNEDCLFAHI